MVLLKLYGLMTLALSLREKRAPISVCPICEGSQPLIQVRPGRKRCEETKDNPLVSSRAPLFINSGSL
jgi:hypothetical protein